MELTILLCPAERARDGLDLETDWRPFCDLKEKSRKSGRLRMRCSSASLGLRTPSVLNWDLAGLKLTFSARLVLLDL